MIIHASPQGLVKSSDHPLWWMVDRPFFSSNVLGCIAPAYTAHEATKKPIRGAGNKRYGIAMELLYDMFQKDFGAEVKKPLGQFRFLMSGPDGSRVQAVIRRGRPTPDGVTPSGITTSKYGTATEQLGRLPFESLQFSAEGIPSHVGLLLFHEVCLDSEKPNHVEVWMAHEWRGQAKSDFIWCEECASLGTMFFGEPEKLDREQTGDSPDL